MTAPAPRSSVLGQVISAHSADQAAETARTVPHADSGMPMTLRLSGWKRPATSRPAAMNPSRKTLGSTRR